MGTYATSFTTQADVAYTRRRGPGAGSLRPPQTYPPSASQESTRRRRVILRIGGTGNRNRARSRSQARQVNPRCWVNVARSPRCRHSYRTQWVCSALNHAKLWAVGLVRSLQSLCRLISVVRVHGRVRYRNLVVELIGFLMQAFDILVCLTRFREQLSYFSVRVSESMAATSCAAVDAAEECRDGEEALRLKVAAIAAILVAGTVGVAIPLVGRKQRLLRTDGGLFVCAKAFAAGVILATGFVHMLHGAESSLTHPCLPDSPWRRFPFAGFGAMLAALGTLVVDFLGTQFYERKQRAESTNAAAAVTAVAPITEPEDDKNGITVISVAPEARGKASGSEKGPMHIFGMHVHSTAHRHGHVHVLATPGRSHGHDHEDGGETSSHARNVVVSQILELGIVSHSVIIGLSLGVSQSPCTIRPLVAALSFHQFFEGFALGGCISQAQFKNTVAAVMACFFAITTPAGIAVGLGIASSYNAKSPRALVVEGLLDSMSAGILIYMALVDLIAADFLSQTMRCNVRLQVASYSALFLGAGAMSALAVWA
ncbi:unnamed protein product [Musa acuminata var. zebrina]